MTAPTTVAPDGRTSLAHLPAVEGLRAIAVVAVVLFHMDLRGATGGFLGVDLFFTLSGFLITRLLLAEYADTGTVSLLGFYDRRFRRLLPATLVVVAVVVVVQDLFGSALTDRIRLEDTRAVLAYVANWHFIASAQDYFDTGPQVSALRHMWSLAVEEQFYVAWPLVVILVLRVGSRASWAERRHRVAVVAAVIGAASAVLFAWRYEPGQVSRAYFGTDTRLFQLLAGALVAVIERRAVGGRRVGLPRRQREQMVVAGLVAIAACYVFVDAQEAPYYHGVGVAFSAVAALVIYHVSRLDGGVVVSALSTRPMVVIGALSYGIYLWHWPVIQWLDVPIGASFLEARMVNMLQAAATLAAASASYRFVEEPIRRGRWVRRVPAPGRLASLAIPVVLVFVLGSRLLAPTANAGDIMAAVDDRSVVSCPGDRFPCAVADFRGPAGGPTVAIVGDSTIQAFSMGVLASAEEHGWRVVQAARGACPIGHVLVQYGTGPQVVPTERQVECFEMHDQVRNDLIAEYDPDVILAGSISDRLPYVTDGGLVANGTPEHVELARSALLMAYMQLTSGGASVVVIQPFPLGYGVDCFEREGDEGACFRPIADDVPNRQYEDVVTWVADELGDHVSVIDLDDEICEPAGCPLRLDGVVVRYDGTHLTGTWSRRLGPLVEDALRETGVDLNL